jgi:PEP-CTERM motif
MKSRSFPRNCKTLSSWVVSAALIFCFVTMSVPVAAPAMAATVYSNGPINGTTDAWNISSGFAVSDSFITNLCCDGNTRITGLQIGVWLLPGDFVQSVDVALGSQPFGGNFADLTLVNPTSQNLGENQYGYDLQVVLFSVPGHIFMRYHGPWYLTLQNAVEGRTGDPIYWDENSGIDCPSQGCPSVAFENQLGTIPSEAFTVLGYGGVFPEPSSIWLFGSGILGVAGILRRKLHR